MMPIFSWFDVAGVRRRSMTEERWGGGGTRLGHETRTRRSLLTEEQPLENKREARLGASGGPAHCSEVVEEAGELGTLGDLRKMILMRRGVLERRRCSSRSRSRKYSATMRSTYSSPERWICSRLLAHILPMGMEL